MNVSEFRAAIKDAGLTFAEAGRLIGVSEPTIRRLVSPSRSCSEIPLRDALALSAALAQRESGQ